MTMRILILMGSMMVSAAHLTAQSPAPPAEAVRAAFAEIVGDFPEGNVIIYRERLPAGHAAVIAQTLSAQAANELDVVRCATSQRGRRTCKLKDAVGALGFRAVRSSQANRKDLVVFSNVQVENETRSWLHYREYLVTVERDGGKAWKVIDSRMIMQS
jgi:hypothetical protein